MSILILDHNFIFLRSLREILTQNFPLVTIRNATSAKEGYRKLKQYPCAVVFLDINLPGGKGLEIGRAIKASHHDITVIMMSHNDLPEYHIAARNAHIDFFISKDHCSIEHILALTRYGLSKQKPIKSQGRGPHPIAAVSTTESGR